MTNKPQILLFTNPTCPHCPAAKRFAESNLVDRGDVEMIFMDSMDPDDQIIARKLQVMSVPTFIILGEGYDKPIGVSGTPNLEHLEKLISLANGDITESEARS